MDVAANCAYKQWFAEMFLSPCIVYNWIPHVLMQQGNQRSWGPITDSGTYFCSEISPGSENLFSMMLCTVGDKIQSSLMNLSSEFVLLFLDADFWRLMNLSENIFRLS